MIAPIAPTYTVIPPRPADGVLPLPGPDAPTFVPLPGPRDHIPLPGPDAGNGGIVPPWLEG